MTQYQCVVGIPNKSSAFYWESGELWLRHRSPSIPSWAFFSTSWNNPPDNSFDDNGNDHNAKQRRGDDVQNNLTVVKDVSVMIQQTLPIRV